MVDPLPTPKDARADARQRALRTFIQGLGATVVTTGTAWIVTNATGIEWTKAGVIVASVALGQTVATAVLSYVGRFLAPPSD